MESNDILRYHVKHWGVIIILSLIPTIGIHYLVMPLWQHIDVSNEKSIDTMTTVTSVETMTTILFLPIYLVIINYLLSRKYKTHPGFFIINGIIIITCIIVSERLHFANWANSVGSWTNPDNDTIEVGDLERSLGVIISTIGIIIAFLRLYYRYRQLNKNKVIT